MTALRPSNASRWMACGGCVAQCAASPVHHDGLENTAAEEGTAAHWVFEQLYRGAPVAEGGMSPNHVIVTDEMLEYGCELVALLPEFATVEQEVDLSHIGMAHVGQRDVSWHADGVANILDYKFGHKFVDERENWQVLTYFADIDFDALGVTSLSVHIYQPRCYDRAPYRVWTLSVKEYREKYLAAITQQIALINSGGAPLVAGKQCYMCPAAASCPALSNASYGELDALYSAGSPHLLNPAQLARELDALARADELINARKLSLEEQAHSVLGSGAVVPGWERSQTSGRLKWTKQAEDVFAAGKMFGKELAAPAKAVTPTQAIALGVPEKVVKSISERPPGKMKLKKVDGNLARKVFAK